MPINRDARYRQLRAIEDALTGSENSSAPLGTINPRPKRHLPSLSPAPARPPHVSVNEPVVPKMTNGRSAVGGQPAGPSERRPSAIRIRSLQLPCSPQPSDQANRTHCAPLLQTAIFNANGGHEPASAATAPAQHTLSPRTNTPIDPDLDVDYDALSSSPTMVGSSPPPRDFKNFYSLSTLFPPHIPAPSPTLSAPIHHSRDIRSVPATTTLLRHQTGYGAQAARQAAPPVRQTRHDSATWSTLPKRKRPPPPSHTAVRHSGPFRLPLITGAAAVTGAPMTQRVRTYMPLPRQVFGS
jgi:hypothetical protein